MTRGRAGMTLIELVVALAISGVAVASGYQAFATMSDHRSVAAERADSIARAFNLRATLTRWLSNARLTVEEDEVVFRGLDAERRLGRGGPPATDLVFLTSARSLVGDRGTIVHLFVAHDSDGAGLTAELSEWRGRRTARLVLDPSIDGLSIEYSSVLGERSDPTRSWVSSTILPAAIRLRFSSSLSGALPPLLRLPLTVRLDGSSVVPVRGAM